MRRFAAQLPEGENMAQKKPSTTARALEIIEPAASELGLEIWDIRFLKEGADWYLRVFIDKPGGVSIDDCVNLSRAIDKPLDEADFITQSYILEVSSPGVERELKTPRHFERCLGERVKLKTIRPVDGVREFSGVLTDYDSSNIVVKTDSADIVFNKKELAYVRLDDFGGNE